MFLLGTGSEKDPPLNGSPDKGEVIPDTTDYSQGVYIINEGNFQAGNGSITYYNRQSKEVMHQLFRKVNGYKLGDVPQSMTIGQEKGWIMVNNSQKIEVVELSSFTVQATISPLTSPRYMEKVFSGKAYVTDIYAEAISIIDPANDQKTGDIPASGWTEQLVEVNGKVFVTNMDEALVYVLDPQKDQLVDSIPVTKEPNSIVADQNSDLWVLCSGGREDTIPTLYRIDPSTYHIEQEYRFSSQTMYPEELVISPGKDTLYYINEDVYQLSIQASSLPSQPFIDVQSRNFYGVAIDPKTHHVFIADAKDYTQQGAIYRFAPNSTLVDSFTAGYIPGEFAFP